MDLIPTDTSGRALTEHVGAIGIFERLVGLSDRTLRVCCNISVPTGAVVGVGVVGVGEWQARRLRRRGVGEAHHVRDLDIDYLSDS